MRSEDHLRFKQRFQGGITQMIKAVLFDLDGTLLGMNEEKFLEIYLPGLIASFSTPVAFKDGVNMIFKALDMMIANPNPNVTNYDSYKRYFTELRKDQATAEADFINFEAYYKTDFEMVKKAVWVKEEMVNAVKLLKERGYRLVIATNPVFPRIAIEKRIEWAHLDIADFEFVTYQENSHAAKPHLEYYKEILAKLNLKGEECLMVGNDVEEDMIAAQLGLKTYLVTDCLISRHHHENQIALKGDPQSFYNYVKEHFDDCR